MRRRIFFNQTPNNYYWKILYYPKLFRQWLSRSAETDGNWRTDWLRLVEKRIKKRGRPGHLPGEWGLELEDLASQAEPGTGRHGHAREGPLGRSAPWPQRRTAEASWAARWPQLRRISCTSNESRSPTRLLRTTCWPFWCHEFFAIIGEKIGAKRQLVLPNFDTIKSELGSGARINILENLLRILIILLTWSRVFNWFKVDHKLYDCWWRENTLLWMVEEASALDQIKLIGVS